MDSIKNCGLCSKAKLLEEFVPCGEDCLFQKDGLSSICYDCLIEKVDFYDLDSVNKMC